MRTPTAVDDETAHHCFHCGEVNPQSSQLRADMDGVDASFCCAGCLAIAQTIRAAGLATFYLRRDRVAAPLQPSDDDCTRIAEVAATIGLVTPLPGGGREVALLLEGVRCGACTWLIETWLARQPGVREAAVNFATRRARVRFAEDETDLATILRAISVIGYRAHPYDRQRRETLTRRESLALLRRMALALLGSMQIMMFAAPAYVSGDGVDPEFRSLMNWASLVIAVPVVLYSATPFLAGAWRDLRRLHRPGMDVPIALGIVAAFAASAWSTMRGAGPLYFDSVTMFVALVLAARWLELRLREKAGDVLEANAHDMPATAERVVGDPNAAVSATVAAYDLAGGDIVRIAAGAVVPADGEVVEGRSSVEEALLTGESWPLTKTPGDRLLAGSINRESPLVMRVSRAGAATALGAIGRLVEQAAGERPRIARLADRVAAVFVAALLAIAAIATLAWWRIDPDRAVAIAVAVLVVSCPCALSLATPAAIASAAGAMARRGVLLVRADAIEALSRVTHVVLDKTGTLTTGPVRLLNVELFAGVDRERCLSLAAALEQGSTHPIARALVAFTANGCTASEVVAIQGSGVEGTIDGERYRLGRIAWVAALRGDGAPDAIADAGQAVIALGNTTQLLAILRLGDRLRDSARRFVASLRDARLHVTILSGDRAGNVAQVAEAVGVSDWHADAAPEDKRSFVAALQQHGGVVAMIGDGINDAPSLARADVSIAHGDAAAFTQWTADVILVGDDLAAAAFALDAARRTFRVIRQNLGWALVYNLLAIPLAATGHLSPLLAAAGMSASSLIVVANAWRLSRLSRAAGARVGAAGAPIAAPAR
jgi:P-type Cu2+ transporter